LADEKNASLFRELLKNTTR